MLDLKEVEGGYVIELMHIYKDAHQDSRSLRNSIRPGNYFLRGNKIAKLHIPNKGMYSGACKCTLSAIRLLPRFCKMSSESSTVVMQLLSCQGK